MKLVLAKTRVSVLVTLLVACTASAAGIEGSWMTEQGDAIVTIAPCGETLCGKVVWMHQTHDDHGNIRRDIYTPDPALREREIIGIDLVHGLPLEPDARGVYRGGRVYDPKSGKTYRCYAKALEDDRLKLRGFIGFALIGRTTYWSRAEVPGASPAP